MSLHPEVSSAHPTPPKEGLDSAFNLASTSSPHPTNVDFRDESSFHPEGAGAGLGSEFLGSCGGNWCGAEVTSGFSGWACTGSFSGGIALIGTRGEDGEEIGCGVVFGSWKGCGT